MRMAGNPMPAIFGIPHFDQNVQSGEALNGGLRDR
jgi:hypothetical protein